MTVLTLSLWIVLALLVQALVFALVAWWRSPEPARTPVPSSAPESGWEGFRRLRVVRRESANSAQDICSFHLAAEDDDDLPDYRPGQYLTFRLNIPGASAPVVRCYTLSDAPGSAHYRVSIKRVPGGQSSNYFHEHIAVGTVLDARAPGGHFVLDEGTSPVVLIAGGIGITPLLSMAVWALQTQAQREVWLFYGARGPDDVIEAPRLAQLASAYPHFHLHWCFSQAQPAQGIGGGQVHAGRLTLELLRLHLPLKTFDYYLCGPGALLETMVPGLVDWGVAPEHIHYEAFGPSTLKAPVAKPKPSSQGAAHTVRFSRAGKQARWTPAAGSLLDLAEAKGVSVASGCRAGNCGTCETRVLSGTVAYDQTPDFTPQAGHCLLCMGVPESDVTLEV